MALTITFLVLSLFSMFCLYTGMRLTKVEGSLKDVGIIAVVSTLVGFIPVVGWVISIAVLLGLICKRTDAKLWPDAVLMVIVTEIVSVFSVFFLGELFQ